MEGLKATKNISLAHAPMSAPNQHDWKSFDHLSQGKGVGGIFWESFSAKSGNSNPSPTNMISTL